MISKEIEIYLNNLSDNLTIVNKLIVEAYLKFNNIIVKRNEILLSLISGNNKDKTNEFIELIKSKNVKFDLEDLIHLFEITIPSNDVSVNGAVYTPNYIKKFIVQESLTNFSNSELCDLTVADISCGAGAFLYTVSESIKEKTDKSYFEIFRDNIYGLDISDYSIERSKILLSLLAISNGEDIKSFNFNLITGNALCFEWNKLNKKFKGFDVIVGNPPYVRAKHLSKETKKLLSNWEVTKSGNPDLYIPFFEIGLKHLKANGILGYITVNTFKRSVNARNLRAFFKLNSLNIRILDFGNAQVFQDKSTYTCIVFIHNNTSEVVKYQKLKPENIIKNELKNYDEINYNQLDTKKGWVLSNIETLKIINKIESTGISFGKKFSIKNGLATLSNDIFIFKPIKEDEDYYYLQNGKLYKIEKSICRDIVKPNRLKFEYEIPQLMEKIIFPYYRKANNPDKDLNKNVVFEEQYFANNFPFAYKYLKENIEQLLNRDKGKPKKYKWFEFGRTQALSDFGKKLLFPYMAEQPYFVYTDQEDLLLYAGYAVYFDSERELKVLKRILESKIFWYYVRNTSKPYSNNYYALAKNYVKDFGLCQLTEKEKDFLLETGSLEERNMFLYKKYKINSNLIEKAK